jgi:hypothetical protein
VRNVGTRNAEVARRLASAAAAVDVVLREHLADMGGELLPYLFMGDLARWALANTPVSAQSPLPDDLAAVLAVLELALTDSDQPMRDLVGAGFLENLIGDTTQELRLRRELPSRLGSQMALTLGESPRD